MTMASTITLIVLIVAIASIGYVIGFHFGYKVSVKWFEKETKRMMEERDE